MVKERYSHADDVRKQIRDKEQIKISERNAFFEEGIKMETEAKQRRARLESVSCDLCKFHVVTPSSHYLLLFDNPI